MNADKREIDKFDLSSRGFGVIDPVQLTRIESVHRGYLYQHLYAAACILKLGKRNCGSVYVELDEDVEISDEIRFIFVQVKTRSHPLRFSDIQGALCRFEELRSKLKETHPEKVIEFAIATNVDLGPELSRSYGDNNWPSDVSLITPTEDPLDPDTLPPAWTDLNEAILWCTNAAEEVPFATLHPETLIWKLAARVQFAATGEDLDRDEHVFNRADLPHLFEQLIEQLQEFPDIPSDFRPQTNEPDLESAENVRLIVGLSGSGKTVWAAWQARHSSGPTAYFDVGDLPGNAIASSLARELAARFLGSGGQGAAQLPSASGVELLQALNNRIELPARPIVVVDNVHRVDVDDMRRIAEVCRNVQLVLLAQPWPEKARLQALLDIQAEELSGWNPDTIAEVFANAGSIISPSAATEWQSITAGMPLFVKNAALLSVTQSGGDAAQFAKLVQSGAHPEELAQDAILRITIEALSKEEAALVTALSLATPSLSADELVEYVQVLEPPIANHFSSVRALQRQGVVQVFANGFMKIHDAMRVPVADLVADLPAKRLLALQVKLRDILLTSITESKDLVRYSAWLRLLPPTGDVETLVDLATFEAFHEFGEPQDLKEVLISVANAQSTDANLRFWALDALSFWEFQETGSSLIPDEYLDRMSIIADQGHVGKRERSALAMKKMLNAGHKGDMDCLKNKFRRVSELSKNDPIVLRIARYNYATSLFHCGDIQGAMSEAESAYAEYFDILNLDPMDIMGANNEQIIALLPGNAGDHQDDLKHLADCLNLTARCKRLLGMHPRLTAIHALKFYVASESYRSAMAIAQDITDDFIGMRDYEGARLMMEDHVLPFLHHMRFESSALDVRTQYAVVLAYCGDISSARAEMSLLEPYIADAPLEHQQGIANQRRMIEQLTANPPASTTSSIPIRRVKKVGRNEKCPCGSGKKYKKCCLK